MKSRAAGVVARTRKKFRLACLFLAVVTFLAALPGRAEDVRIDLDQRTEPYVKPKIDSDGFAIHVTAEGYLQKQEPTRIRLETKQVGRWVKCDLDTGRYLRSDYDPEDPREIRIETMLKFDLTASERRHGEELQAIQRAVAERTTGRDGPAVTKARNQILIERIAVLRKENIDAGADPKGRASLHAPPLPRQPLAFEKTDALERILKEHCRWRGVAQVFQATGFRPPNEKDYPDFAASQTMADEIDKAMKGIKFTPQFLNDGQYNTLAQGNRYAFSVRFVPELPGMSADLLWRAAPAVRLADGVVKRAQLEGSLDRQRGQSVAWWRIECSTPPRIQAQMTKGQGDCFWTWVESPNEQVRYLRLLLHSPGTRYRLNLTLGGAAKGEELIVYDGPVNAPTSGPF